MPAPTGALAPDDVLIRPLITRICGTDLHEYIAGPIVTPKTPHVYTGAQNPQILGASGVRDHRGSWLECGHLRAGQRIAAAVAPRDDYYGKRELYHLSKKLGCVGLSRHGAVWPSWR